MKTWMIAALLAILGLAVGSPATAEKKVYDFSDPALSKKPTHGSNRFIPPPYPMEASRKGEEGTVEMKVCVHPDGRVKDVKVASSSGSPALDVAAVSWMSQQTVSPGIAKGANVSVCGWPVSWVWKLPEGRSGRYPLLLRSGAETPPRRIGGPTDPRIPDATLKAWLRTNPSGEVSLSLCVGPTGKVESVGLNADGDMTVQLLVGQWANAQTYSPAQKDGKAIGVCGVELTYSPGAS